MWSIPPLCSNGSPQTYWLVSNTGHCGTLQMLTNWHHFLNDMLEKHVCLTLYTYVNVSKWLGQILTVLFHSQDHAALKSAVLAAVPVVLVDDTLSGPPACINQVLPDAALEEALTALTAHCPVVAAWGRRRRNRVSHTRRRESVCVCARVQVQLYFLPTWGPVSTHHTVLHHRLGKCLVWPFCHKLEIQHTQKKAKQAFISDVNGTFRTCFPDRLSIVLD